METNTSIERKALQQQWEQHCREEHPEYAGAFWLRPETMVTREGCLMCETAKTNQSNGQEKGLTSCSKGEK